MRAMQSKNSENIRTMPAVARQQEVLLSEIWRSSIVIMDTMAQRWVRWW